MLKTLTLMTDANPKVDHSKSVYANLRYILDMLGVKYEMTLGKYEGKDEPSYCIEGLTRAQAISLAKAYGQESLCFMEGSFSMGNSWKLIYVNGENEGKYLNQSGRVVFSDVEPKDNFTKFNNGGYLQIDFNWGHFRKFRKQ